MPMQIENTERNKSVYQILGVTHPLVLGALR